jgi:hypothetical protein
MTPPKYIIQELNDFILKFPQTRVRYEYDELSDAHFIEVVPNNIYYLDEAYIAWESDLYDKFIASYPDQNICFISDDAVVGLENIQFELIGSIFEILYSTNRTETIVEESIIKVTGLVKTNSFSCFTSNSDTSPINNNASFVLQDYETWILAA